MERMENAADTRACDAGVESRLDTAGADAAPGSFYLARHHTGTSGMLPVGKENGAADAAEELPDDIDRSPVVVDELSLAEFDEEIVRQLNLEEAATSAAVPGGDAVEASKTDEAEVREWDVKHGPSKSGTLGKVSMVLPTVTRVLTNLVGVTTAAGGYAVGKAGEKMGAKKTVDSLAFKAGITSWLLANGIVPSVKYEPLGPEAAQLAHLYGSRTPENEKDIALTPMLISNHMSYLDGIILAVVFGAPRIVAMADSKKTPIIGKFMQEMDVVFVDRGSSGSRQATIEAISEHCAYWSPGQRPLLIFPEGTTTNGEGLLPFRKGAFVAGVPVRPVLIVYTGQWDPACTTYKETKGGQVEKHTDAEWAAQFMGHFVHSLHVRVLAPYIPNAKEKADADLYASNCQAYMARELERVHAELQARSWKEAAGRTDGGLGYRFGDVTRIGFRRVKSTFSRITQRRGETSENLSSG